LHSKNDKEIIAAWKLDLNGALLVFNVRFVVCACPSLSAFFQTELVINIHVDVVDTRAVITDMRRNLGNLVKSQEGAGGRDQPVTAVPMPIKSAYFLEKGRSTSEVMDRANSWTAHSSGTGKHSGLLSQHPQSLAPFSPNQLADEEIAALIIESRETLRGTCRA